MVVYVVTEQQQFSNTLLRISNKTDLPILANVIPTHS